MALSDPAVSRRAPTAFADDSLYRQYSISTVTRAAEYLRDIPQRKKTLFYVSVGIPVERPSRSWRGCIIRASRRARASRWS